MKETKWTDAEKKAARRAFEAAFRKECDFISTKLKEMISNALEPADLWRIHDYLSDRREEIDGKYDYRYLVLIAVFGRLLREGWLSDADLKGLSEDKIERIKHIGSL